MKPLNKPLDSVSGTYFLKMKFIFQGINVEQRLKMREITICSVQLSGVMGF